jgi:hypothetical protein
MSARWNQRPIGPVIDHHHENSHVLFGNICRESGRSGEIGSPRSSYVAWDEPHQMWVPGFTAVVLVLLSRHHVAHRSGLERWKFFAIICR